MQLETHNYDEQKILFDNKLNNELIKMTQIDGIKNIYFTKYQTVTPAVQSWITNRVTWALKLQIPRIYQGPRFTVWQLNFT